MTTSKPTKPVNSAQLVLKVTITRTSDGVRDYIQVMSEDCVTVNIVLVADRIEVKDAR